MAVIDDNQARPHRVITPYEYEKYFQPINMILKEMQIDTERYKIDMHHWLKFNELRDRGISLSEIRGQTEIHETPALFTLEYARICTIKYNGDIKRLRECLEGKIS